MNLRPTRLPFVVVLALGAALYAAWLLARDDEEASELTLEGLAPVEQGGRYGPVDGPVEVRSSSAGQSEEHRSVVPASVEPEPAEESTSVHVRDFLADFWGERWPEVRRWMESSGRPVPDFRLDPGRFAPLEEAMPHIERSVLFGGVDRTEQQCRERVVKSLAPNEFEALLRIAEQRGEVFHGDKRFTRAEVEVLAQRVAPYHAEVERVAARIADVQMEVRARALMDGKWVAHPFLVYEPEFLAVMGSQSGGTTAMIGGAVLDWHFNAVADYSAHPHYDQLMAELARAKHQMEEQAEEYAASLGQPLW